MNVMPLALFGFINISIADLLDILIVAVIIFLVLKWVKGSSTVSIFITIISLYLIRAIAVMANMRMLSSLMSTILGLGVMALIIIFQPEIRRFLIRMGDRYREASENRFLRKFFSRKDSAITDISAKEIAEACWAMSASKTGALIVLQHSSSLDEIISTGDRLDAIINRRLIMNIFFKNSPLHDGALIIGSDRLIAARCTLPITERTDLPPQYGMRHKAAMGMSEESDADIIVVSEETGGISFVNRGTLTRITGQSQFKLLLDRSMAQKKEKDEE